MWTFIVELRRRSVFRVAGGYFVIAWLLIQLAIALEVTLLLPAWFDTAITVTMLIGFPVALILAWAFEMTPEGIKRTETDPNVDQSHHFHRLRLADGVIAASLLVLVGLTTWSMTTGGPVTDERPVGQVASEALGDRSEPEGQRNEPSSIAVLPFADMSANHDQEYFADGVAEEILNALVRIPDLRVAGRTSAFAFKNSEDTLKDIGKALSVNHILEGSVRKDGSRVRITATLIEAESGFNLWSETYNETLDNVFDLQEQISRAVARELRGVLHVGEGDRLADRLTDDPVAYDLFLRGRDLVNSPWGAETLPRAIGFLEDAVAKDPDFVAAWKMLGYANFLLPTYSRVRSPDPYLEAAEAAAERAIELDPTDPGGHSLIATLRLAENRLAQGLRRSELMQRLGPNDPESDYSHGYRLSVIGNSRAALPFLEEALAVNPNSNLWLMADGVVRLNMGDLKGAMAAAQKSLDLGFPGAAFLIADVMLVEGRPQDAYDFLVGAYDRLSYMAPEFADRNQWILAGRALYLGEPEARKVILGLVNAARADPDIPMSTSIMNAYLSTGDAETFMEAFAADPYPNGSYVLSRLWDDREATTAIRTHPAFPAWADSIGLVRAWNEFGWPEKCKPDTGTDGTGGRLGCV